MISKVYFLQSVFFQPAFFQRVFLNVYFCKVYLSNMDFCKANLFVLIMVNGSKAATPTLRLCHRLRNQSYQNQVWVIWWEETAFTKVWVCTYNTTITFNNIFINQDMYLSTYLFCSSSGGDIFLSIYYNSFL